MSPYVLARARASRPRRTASPHRPAGPGRAGTLWRAAAACAALAAAAACADPVAPLARATAPRAEAGVAGAVPLSQLSGSTPGFALTSNAAVAGNTFTFGGFGASATSPAVDARSPQAVVVEFGSPATTNGGYAWVSLHGAGAGEAGLRFRVEPETGRLYAYTFEGDRNWFLDASLRYVQLSWEPGVGVHVAQSASPTGPFERKVTAPIPAAFTTEALANAQLVLWSHDPVSVTLVPQAGARAADVLAFMAARGVPSVADVQAQGGAFARYEQDFASLADYHWNLGTSNFGGSSQSANYYDRAMIYYVWWARTGNATYRDRADSLALAARQYLSGAQPMPEGYDPGGNLQNSPYNPQSYQMMLDGVALHALVTGDTVSRYTVARVADNMASGYWYYTAGVSPASGSEGDGRNSARVLGAILDAYLLGVPSPAGYDYAAKLRELMPRVLAGQDADGAYRWVQSQCGYDKPFMDGMLNDALIRYYASFEADPRIPPAVRRSVDYLWANDWRPDAAAFVYLDGDCGDRGGPGAAADLNNMIVSGFEFTARQTGDASYRAKADAVFAGGVDGVWLYGTKQFNQEYTSSYRFLALRFGGALGGTWRAVAAGPR